MTVRFLLGLAACAMLQANEADLRRAFLGKQVMLKIDMPGTQQGVDLNLDRDDRGDFNDYVMISGRKVKNPLRQEIVSMRGRRPQDTQRYDAKPGSAWLIRPDQHVVARWRHLDAPAIRAALARAT